MASPGTASALENDSQVVEGNKALVGRLLDEGLIDGNQTIVSELYDPGFVGRDGWARQMPGPVGLPMSRTDYKIAFPDLTVTLDAIVAEGDFVATHESRWSSHPPTGTHLEGQTMHLVRIANGQIMERWRAGWEWFPPRGGQPELRRCNPLLGH
ncbi:MAG: ester cyclase [Thermomicrobiales bacterium]